MPGVTHNPEYDVAIVGGGPGGSTTGAMLRKHCDARVLILEREQFPREHVGESQLPPIGRILEELGCWDEVEAANFPIKIGATLRWGRETNLWDFDFLPHGKLAPQARPAAYAGQRVKTALQVDRAIYDDILLRHAERLGCEVRQATKVAKIQREGDRITGLELDDGSVVQARWYVDASGGTGVVRRAMGVEIECPSTLKNVAAWDYWDDVEWAETIAQEGTRVQVLSLGHGWVWFIPVTANRASVGLVVSAQYYKDSGLTLEALYQQALQQEPRVRTLLAHAKVRGQTRTTKDWSFLADRSYGENWFLVGESVGFADPILAAGLTLTQTGARELAYTLAALVRGEHDPAWLATHYDDNQRARIRQHIRFADFWYANNGQFTDLQDECRSIAQDAGLSMSAEEAWRWLAQGGFANDVIGQAVVGGYDLASVKQVTQRFLGQKSPWKVSAINVVRLALDGTESKMVPYYHAGKVVPTRAFDRDGKRLTMVGTVGLVASLVPKHPRTPDLLRALQQELTKRLGPEGAKAGVYHALQGLELLLSEGWAVGSVEPGRPFVNLNTPDEGAAVHRHHESESSPFT